MINNLAVNHSKNKTNFIQEMTYTENQFPEFPDPCRYAYYISPCISNKDTVVIIELPNLLGRGILLSRQYLIEYHEAKAHDFSFNIS